MFRLEVDEVDKAAQVLGSFGKVLPELSERELDRLLAFGEGMAFMAHQEKARPQDGGQNAAQPSA